MVKYIILENRRVTLTWTTIYFNGWVKITDDNLVGAIAIDRIKPKSPNNWIFTIANLNHIWNRGKNALSFTGFYTFNNSVLCMSNNDFDCTIFFAVWKSGRFIAPPEKFTFLFECVFIFTQKFNHLIEIAFNRRFQTSENARMPLNIKYFWLNN